MAFYYVKNGGTATGDGGRTTTERTGVWSGTTSVYYDSVGDCFSVPTTGVVDGDIIRCSHVHDNNVTTGDNFIGVDVDVTIQSVDNANQENYLKGAIERVTSSGGELEFIGASGGSALCYGITFLSADNIHLSAGADAAFIHVEDGEIGLTGASATDDITSSGSSDTQRGSVISIKDSNLRFGAAGQSLELFHGNKFIIDNITLVGTAATTLVTNNAAGGGSALLKNSDLSNLSTTGGIFDNCDNDEGDQVAHLEIYRCLIPASKTIFTTGSVLRNFTGKAHAIGIGTSKDDFNYFEEVSSTGKVTQETAIYRTLGATDGAGNNFSAELASKARTFRQLPLTFKLVAMHFDAGADATKLVFDGTTYTSSITFKIHCARDGNATKYDDDEVFFDIEYSDGAENAMGVVTSSEAGFTATPVALTTETSLWTGLGGTNAQMSESITLTIGSSAGNIGPGIVTIIAKIGIPSDSVFIDPDVVLS